ncbi:MAG: coproporphyrinogen III oxidase family protein, partial [Proteobacteria bacterium]|nr:coproporphyrinogen III oxidase family protein [Pseudomonadota bacterium]
ADYASRHNLQYWRNMPYIGLGAGAHGYVGDMRIANVLAPAAYIQRCSNGTVKKFPRTQATVNAKVIDTRTEMGDTMMMGLRLLQEGVSAQSFLQRFDQSLDTAFGDEINDLKKLGLLEWGGEDDGSLRLTPKGRFLGNQVFLRFI